MEKSKILPNILVTGTPGVGKTSVCLSLLECLKERGFHQFSHIQISELVVKKKLYKNWNKEYDVPEFEEKLVCDELENPIQEGGKIIEFHSCDFFPSHWFSLVVLLRCDNTQLYDRLTKRNYNEKKIKENIECEIMEVTSEEVNNAFEADKILTFDNSKIDNLDKNSELIADKIIEIINKKK